MRKYICILLLLALLTACAPNGSEQTQPTPSGGLSPETTVGENEITVQTRYATLSYPVAFEEVIQVSTTNYGQADALEFAGDVFGTVVPLYTLWFNGDAGLPVGTLITEAGEIKITVEIHPAPDMTASELETFYAAQETVNQVLFSLAENEGFTEA